MKISDIQKDLKASITPGKAEILSRFFKTGKGEYGEGDVFIGVMVPEIRKVAKKYKDISLNELQKMMSSKIHEERLCAALILTYRKLDQNVVDFYLSNTPYLNNWDIIDLTAPKVLGKWMLAQRDDRKILYKFAKSKSLWERRIAVLSTFAFIREKDFEDTLAIAEILLQDNHDLIHKAVGWMLREIGKRDQKIEEKFLKKFYKKMPRTMLRYAIERFEETKRKSYLNGTK
ncbi:DNA alkylation repair protein [Patescibacteria group bacterium]